MSPITPETLGFTPLPEAVSDEGEQLAWTKTLRGGPIVFRLLRSLEELAPAESIQRDVFGCDDIDIANAGMLVTVHETGGDVVGASRLIDGVEKTVGLSIGWGGYFALKPVFISDILAVREEVRYAGIGVEIKKLQAAIASARGFNEVTWTVDPLRAPNARLNFEKLGAVSNRYEQNRYGESYGTALYGGLPSDRLHISWRLNDPTLLDRLNGKIPARSTADLLGALAFDPLVPTVDRAFALIPADFDALLKADYDAALAWRMELRRLLPAAFEAGLTVTGFIANADVERNAAALLLTRIDS
jgi:predicted GNAT superfamily acetyltransferase